MNRSIYPAIQDSDSDKSSSEEEEAEEEEAEAGDEEEDEEEDDADQHRSGEDEQLNQSINSNVSEDVIELEQEEDEEEYSSEEEQKEGSSAEESAEDEMNTSHVSDTDAITQKMAKLNWTSMHKEKKSDEEEEEGGEQSSEMSDTVGSADDEEECSSDSDGDTDFTDQFPFERNIFILARYYDFIKRLYSCADAVTFKAIEKNSGKLVVIKISEGLNYKSRVPIEVRLLIVAQGHPNIVKFLGWHRLERTNCFAHVTEYIENGSPEKYLFGKPERIQAYMKDMLNALQHLQSRNILYRDCKPSNCLYNPHTNIAQMIDFDVSTFYNPVNLHRSAVGTDNFMSPEMMAIQAAKESPSSASPPNGYNLQTDLFSVGMVFGSLLYEYSESEVADNENSAAKAQSFLHITRSLIETKQNGHILPQQDLLLNLLDPNPSTRITVEQALSHSYFNLIFPKSSKQEEAGSLTQ
jgi:hypothetical protein